MANVHVARWSDPDAVDPRVAGGKAASLATMAQALLPVPAGFVVLADAYRLAVADVALELSLPAPGPDAATDAVIDDVADAVRRQLMTVRVPERVRAEVAAAYAAIGSPVVAVRSSATAEDLHGASFAGQYDTVLGIDQLDALWPAIVAVWASLHSGRALAYRHLHGIGEADLAMAVVVQELVPSDAAGVLFTRHPVSGDEGVYVVNAARGQGEGVVTGTVTVDRWTLDATTSDVVDADVSYQEQMLVVERGALRRVDVPEPSRAQPALDDEQLAELGELARRVRVLYGDHRDVEFAVQDGRVLLLQARPITDGVEGDFPVAWADPSDEARSWSLRSSTPMTALERDIQAAQAARLKVCFDETGSPIARAHEWRFFHGYGYVAAADVTDEEVQERQARQRARLEGYGDAGTSLYEVEVEPVLLERLAELRRTRPRGKKLAPYVRHLELAIAAYADAMGNLHWRIQTPPVDWPAEYAELTGRPPAEASTLLQALSNRTTKLITRLRGIARLVQSDPVLVDVFDRRDWPALDDPAVARRPATVELRRRLTSLQRAHGLRTGMGMGSVATITSPTWRMSPAVPLGMIASYARQDLDALDDRERGLRRDRQRLERAIRRWLVGDPERLARFEVARARMVNAARTTEDHNHLMEQASGGAMREAVLLVGEALVARGWIDVPEDVFHLSVDELAALAEGEGPADVAGLVRRRVAVRSHQARLRPPRTLGSVAAAPDLRAAMAAGAGSEGNGLHGDELRGIGASGGRHVGRAVVAPPMHAPPDVRPGDVLVARIVGDSWTPIFPVLGALVLDQGGMFQHAAVVAREYRIPAVMMTGEATKVVTDGQLLEVDGDEGVVRLLG